MLRKRVYTVSHKSSIFILTIISTKVVRFRICLRLSDKLLKRLEQTLHLAPHLLLHYLVMFLNTCVIAELFPRLVLLASFDVTAIRCDCACWTFGATFETRHCRHPPSTGVCCFIYRIQNISIYNVRLYFSFCAY